MRYFISYENLKNNTELDKDINPYSPELKLVNLKKNGKYAINPLYVFTEHNLDLDSFVSNIESRRPNITIMVELTSDEAKKVHPIFLKRFNDDVLLNPDTTIKLLEKDVINYMDFNEISKGRLINLKSTEDGNFKLTSNKINKNKKDLNIGEGEYFYTEVERTLEKYSDKIIEIEENGKNKYSLKKYKLLVIDSIGQDRTIGLSKDTYSFLYKVCFDFRAVYIKEDDENYTIYSKIVNNSKKAYILENENLDTLIFNSTIRPLFKYINIYELVDGTYKKTSLQTYYDENKLTKKPNID